MRGQSLSNLYGWPKSRLLLTSDLKSEAGSADFSLLSQGIRSRKSGCRHLSASAEATRECELQGSTLPSPVLKNRVREEVLWLRAVS